VRTIVFEKDTTLQDKSNKLGAYVLVSPVHTELLSDSLSQPTLGSRQARRRRDLQLRPWSQGTPFVFEDLVTMLIYLQKKAEEEVSKAADKADSNGH
jgi:hypothetical protein